MTIQQAITRSVNHNEIVTLHADDAEHYETLCAELAADADDDVEHRDGEGDIREFWGRTDDGDWRVHVRLS